MEPEKISSFQWFLYIIFIPLLFTLLLSGIVLSILGVPVVGKVRTVYHLLQTQTQTTASQKTMEQNVRNTNTTQEIQQLQAENKQLKADSDDKNQQISSLKQQVVQLQQQLTAANQVHQNYQDQANIYAAMKPDQAATIIQELPEDVALQVLAHLTQQAAADILDKMDPKMAANYLAKLARQ